MSTPNLYEALMPSAAEVRRTVAAKMSGTQYQLDRLAAHDEERRRGRAKRDQEARGKGLSATERQAASITRLSPPNTAEELPQDPREWTPSQKQHAVLLGKADTVRTAAVRRRRDAFLGGLGRG